MDKQYETTQAEVVNGKPVSAPIVPPGGGWRMIGQNFCSHGGKQYVNWAWERDLEQAEEGEWLVQA